MTTPSPTEARRDALVVNLLRLGYLDKHTARAIADAAFFEMQPLQPQAAQAVQAVPVAWWIPKAEQFCLPSKDGGRPFVKAWEPLYAAPQPPASQRLTGPQAQKIIDSVQSYSGSYELAIVRATEAALGHSAGGAGDRVQVPLTVEQIQACLPAAVRLPIGWLEFARAIEAAHKIVAPAPSSDDASGKIKTGFCKLKAQPGGCPMHNLQCGWPMCDQQPEGE